MSSDDEELAAMRQARAQKFGSAGLTVTAQRNMHHHDTAPQRHRDDDDDDEGPIVVPAADIGGYDNQEDDDNEIPPELRAHLPMSFGSSKPQDQLAAREKAQQEKQRQAEIAVQRKPNDDDDINNEDDDEGFAGPMPAGEETDPYDLPISSEVSLKGHERVITALDIDHSGGRVLTGSMDYTVKIYDFNGMKSDFKPFRSIEPHEGHPIHALSWSPSGDTFLVVTGSPQPKVYDRDGKQLGEMIRGDMYIRDMKNTKGHVSGCTGGQWHPSDRGSGMTCSDDGTVRVWDFWNMEQKTVIKPTLARPGRVAVTMCGYSVDGRLIGAGLMDGTLQLWDVRGKFGQSAAIGVVPQPKAQMVAKQNWTFVSGTNQIVRNAHSAGSEITCISFARDGHSFITRSGDETLKLWDIRQFKKPVAVAVGLPSSYGTTQCCYSPDEKLIVTGVSATNANNKGGLVFLDAKDLSVVRRLGMPGSSVVVNWHPKINQILVGCGDRKSGETRVLFDPSKSTRGALLCVSRRPRAADPTDFVAAAEPEIYNPNALPMYRQQWPGKGGKRKQESEAGNRTSKAFKPVQGSVAPMAGGQGVKGAGGQLGATGGTLLTQYVLKNQGMLKNPKDEDIRASILRHADKQDEFSRFTDAYAATQPTRIYAQPDEEEEGEGTEAGPPPAPSK